MIKKKYIEKIVLKYKRNIEKELKKGNTEFALEIISNCALLLYTVNIKYVDHELEKKISEISKRILEGKVSSKEVLDNNTVLFFDSFGVSNRGLAKIYLNSLCHNKKIIYVTFHDTRDEAKELEKLVEQYGGKTIYINRNRKTHVEQIEQLNSIVEKYRPYCMFQYLIPNDVICTTVSCAYKGIVERVFINLTDHAFWLGTMCLDKCIEFRDYGASISKYYRSIPEEKIVKLPFYPIIDENKSFEGIPFEMNERQQYFFSGGAIYKTLGKKDRYYKVVENILTQHKELIFWYAGSGNNSKLKQLMEKYPLRVFQTEERKDLYQVMNHALFYLNTYPITGGLMYQYAAKAGRVPITLKEDEDAEGFLLDQKKLNVDFADEKELYEEINKLINDKEYYKYREKQMKDAVIKPEEFEKKIGNIIDKGEKNDIEFEKYDTQKFREIYLTRINKIELKALLANRDSIRASLKYEPISFVIGRIYKIVKNQ